MRHIRIKTFIMITVTILAAVSLILVTMSLLFLFSRRFYSDLNETKKNSIASIMNSFETEGFDNAMSDPELLYEMDYDAKTQEGRVLVIDRNYRILKDTDWNNEDTAGTESDDTSAEFATYIIDKRVMKVMIGDTDREEYSANGYMVSIEPIYTGNSIAGVLIYKASNVHFDEAMISITRVALAILAVIFCISMLITVLIAKRSVRDINDINEKIMHNALGDLTEPLPEDEGFIEIQVLAENYNEVLSQLATIDQTRSEFVSNVSHELKTPITSMKVLAESLIQNEGATAEEYKEFMTDIVDEIDRETKIINDLLTLVRTDSKSNQMNLEETDINEMMETIVKTVTPLATQRGISLNYESYREILADVDSVKLSLAISNLIENAVKYNIDNGWIKCSLNSDHKFFYIKVADSGVGIPEDAKDRVFERFYRVDKARSRDTGGTGLGLAITRSIINAHKGTIKLYSESGKGTTFTVKIPLKKS